MAGKESVLFEKVRGCLYGGAIGDAMGAPAVPDSIKAKFRSLFGGALILSGGYDAQRAQADVDAGRADLIAVGRPFLANPDLPRRWQQGAALNAVDFETLYTPGEKGYTDYPALA